MTPNPATQTDPRALKWTAEAYEQARQLRITVAERIVEQMGEEERSSRSREELLDSIATGEVDGPTPVLGRVFRRNREQEREMERLLLELLQEHPAWRWLQEVPGVDHAAAGRLLARLDVRRASTPSAFWAYCGLATVPGTRHGCSVCGLEISVADGARIPAKHTAPGGQQPCEGHLQRLRDKEGERVAQPRAGAGDRPLYDAEAKKICFIIGEELRGAEHLYHRYYLQQRALLDRTRPGWPSGRRHMTAIRKMQKLFLAHLWLVWREALGLPITQPSADAGGGCDASGPWGMTATPRKRWVRREDAVPQLRFRSEPPRS